jgi:hypothetical protein
MGEKRNAYRLLVGMPEGKSQLREPRHMWVDNIKMYLREVGWGSVYWIGLAQGSIKFWESVEWIHNWWPVEYC